MRVCHQGFHASRDIKSAFHHRKGTVLGLVECQDLSRKKGLLNSDGTKFVTRKMRVVTTYSSKHLIALALWCAIKKLPNYEKAYQEKLPRQAIKTIIKGFNESVDLSILATKVQNKIKKLNKKRILDKIGQSRDYSPNSLWSSFIFTANLVRAAGGRLPGSLEKPAQIKQSTAQNVNVIIHSYFSALPLSQTTLFNKAAEEILGLSEKALGDWFSELLDKQDTVKRPLKTMVGK